MMKESGLVWFIQLWNYRLYGCWYFHLNEQGFICSRCPPNRLAIWGLVWSWWPYWSRHQAQESTFHGFCENKLNVEGCVLSMCSGPQMFVFYSETVRSTLAKNLVPEDTRICPDSSFIRHRYVQHADPLFERNPKSQIKFQQHMKL